MNARTETLLYELMWIGDQLMRPSYRALTESYDSWAHRNGVARRLASLQKKGLVEKTQGKAFSSARILKLTDAGLAAAQPVELEPSMRWQRPWDGQWRLMLFDMPAAHKEMRMKLWRFLQDNRFGYLQQSVWVTPDSVSEIRARMGKEKVQVGSLIFLDARPCGGESDEDIVEEAWGFKEINARYRRYMQILDRIPGKRAALEDWSNWVREERVAWQQAVQSDPFLPQLLWPKGYLGKQAWELRQRMLGEAREVARAG
jgi:DNA-binding transcriptional regulator PaaX